MKDTSTKKRTSVEETSVPRKSSTIGGMERHVLQEEALHQLDRSEWTWSHWRAVLIAGTGFLTDSYDNFIIGLMAPMIAYVYFPDSKGKLTASQDGFLKAASSYGNLLGQLIYGFMGDIFGRKKLYGTELVILMIGALGSSVAFNTSQLSILTVLAFWRFLLGVGIGGDYPVSSVITSEFASIKNRGTMIALVFAMQGVGIILAVLVSLTTLSILKPAIEKDTENLDYVWRIMAAFGLIPALSAVYYRWTMPETPRYSLEVRGNAQQAAMDARKYLQREEEVDLSENIEPGLVQEPTIKQKLYEYQARFLQHFGKFENAKVLIATSMCWFLLDIGYYGTNLNTPIVLNAIGYSSSRTPFDHVWSATVGALIIASAGQVPGYFVTVYFVDIWGRKPIQILGFAVLTVAFAVLGGLYGTLVSNALPLFVVIYCIAQFFFNFGPNSTTFIIPAEVFPTAVRSSGHGISAAAGKIGALVAAQSFSHVVNIGGNDSFMAGAFLLISLFSFLGLLFTFWIPETKGLSLDQINGTGDETETLPLVER
jgi:PHS family inorganic phosphate transporter-like MFS transporter